MTDDQNLKNLSISEILALIIWIVYQIARLTLGLVVHPYRTVREIMRGRWFIPLVFLPIGILVWIIVTGRVAAWVIDIPTITRDVLGILYASFIMSLALWQGLLFYLGVRFWVGLRR
jgi:hypothetical protein